MYKVLFLHLFMGICVLANSQEYKSTWTEKPLTIDGKSTEWKDMPRYYDSQTLIMYEVFNDNENLYLIMEVVPTEIQMKLMKVGFQIDFATKIKPKVKASIYFLPVIIQALELNINPQMQEPEKILHDYLLKTSHANVIGFNKTKKSIKRNVQGSALFTYNIGWTEKKHMLFELKVPLHELFESPVNLNAISAKPLSLQLKIYATESPMADNMHENDLSMSMESKTSGMPPIIGGIDHRPVAATPGIEGVAGSEGDLQKQQILTSEKSFKIKVTLSNKPDSN